MSTVRINPLTGFPEVMPDTRGGGIMSGLGSPFASSIRKIAQPIDNGYRGPTQMGPQAALDGTGAVFGNMFSPMTVDNNVSQIPDFFALRNQGPMPRGGYESITENKPAIDLTSLLFLKDASGMPDTRGPNVPGNRPPNPNNSLIDPGFSPNLMGAGRLPVEIDPGFSGPPDFRQPRPGMPSTLKEYVDKYAFPSNSDQLPRRPGYRPDGFNPNMYQRPMRRPFGFGGRPMNPFMGMGIGLMNPMGMGMFGGFPMRPPMFGGYGGYGGGYGGYGGGYNMMRPPMGFGLGGANPYGMNPYSNFGRPNPYPQPSYNMPNPYSSGMSFNQPNFGGEVLQQQQGGYGSYQQPSGYGNYGGMQNPYQPQQQPSYQQGGSISNGFGGGIPNNFAGYGQQQAMF